MAMNTCHLEANFIIKFNVAVLCEVFEQCCITLRQFLSAQHTILCLSGINQIELIIMKMSKSTYRESLLHEWWSCQSCWWSPGLLHWLSAGWSSWRTGEVSQRCRCSSRYPEWRSWNFRNWKQKLFTFNEIFCSNNDLLGRREYLESSIVSSSEFLSQINFVSLSTLLSTLKSHGREMVSLMFLTMSGTKFSFSFLSPLITCNCTSLSVVPYLFLATQTYRPSWFLPTSTRSRWPSSLSRTLSLKVHVITGVGIPDASHNRDLSLPSRTLTCHNVNIRTINYLTYQWEWNCLHYNGK